MRMNCICERAENAIRVIVIANEMSRVGLRRAAWFLCHINARREIGERRIRGE